MSSHFSIMLRYAVLQYIREPKFEIRGGDKHEITGQRHGMERLMVYLHFNRLTPTEAESQGSAKKMKKL